MIHIPLDLPVAAETYARAGIRVFRIRRNKAPYGNCRRCAKTLPNKQPNPDYIKHRPEECRCGVTTCHGFWAATRDIDLVRKWWAEEPDANIGAPCLLNGWSVLDIDPRNGGYQSLCALEERVGVLPGTAMQVTGGDGLHMLYKDPGLDLPKEPFTGVEFKRNNYIVLAPSVHSSGHRYRWVGDGMFRYPQAPWPTQLLPYKERKAAAPLAPRVPRTARQIRRAGGGKRWQIHELVQYVMDAIEGDRVDGRNNRLYFAACRAHQMAEQGHMDLVEAQRALMAAARAVGLDEAEAEATFDSADTRPADRRRAA